MLFSKTYHKLIIGRNFSSHVNHYKLLVCGGGAGGSSVANKFANHVEKVAVIEPNQHHYYQPMWTLVGGGSKFLDQSRHETKKLLSKKIDLIQEKITEIIPEKNMVKTNHGSEITYDYMVCAMGLSTYYDKIPGLIDALEHDPSVGSNYSAKYVEKTFSAFQNFKGGNAIFTFPNTPIKCAGAPQKIMYLFEDYCQKTKKRQDAKIMFNTSLAKIFGVDKYAKLLQEICQQRNIEINFRHNLIAVDHKNSCAEFEHLDTGKKTTVKYGLLHVTPPMGPVPVLQQSSISNDAGWVPVDKETLQHTQFANVFALGDNSDAPTSKTAAAVSAQAGVLESNLKSLMAGGEPNVDKYDGYTSCPLITSYKTCILAEFDYQLAPMETFPFNQGVESKMMYYLKANFMPHLYWQGLTQGLWNGPRTFRKLFDLIRR